MHNLHQMTKAKELEHLTKNGDTKVLMRSNIQQKDYLTVHASLKGSCLFLYRFLCLTIYQLTCMFFLTTYMFAYLSNCLYVCASFLSIHLLTCSSCAYFFIYQYNFDFASIYGNMLYILNLWLPWTCKIYILNLSIILNVTIKLIMKSCLLYNDILSWLNFSSIHLPSGSSVNILMFPSNIGKQLYAFCYLLWIWKHIIEQCVHNNWFDLISWA